MDMQVDVCKLDKYYYNYWSTFLLVKWNLCSFHINQVILQMVLKFAGRQMLAQGFM